MRKLLQTLCVLFGMASWIAVVGVWVELPLLVPVMPEGWSLPSKMSIILQSANVVPFVITMLKSHSDQWINFEKINYSILTMGCLATSLLSHFWDHSIGSTSTPFFILFFFLSIVDCTSSVSFTPFMSRLQSSFLAFYFVGEGCSGAIPALLGLVQGSGMHECVNGTSISEEPRFSVSTFFVMLALMAVLSLSSFAAINLYKGFTPFYVEKYSAGNKDDTKIEEDESKITTSVILPFVLQFIACFISNGFLPSISTFYTLPYGQQTYHISTILSTLANPLGAITLTMIAIKPKTQYLFLLLSIILGSLLFTTACLSPCPPLVDTLLGSILNISISSLFTYFITLVKISVASHLRDQTSDENLLLWYGAITQLGSLAGALSAYPFGNGLLQQRYPCQTC